MWMEVFPRRPRVVDDAATRSRPPVSELDVLVTDFAPVLVEDEVPIEHHRSAQRDVHRPEVPVWDLLSIELIDLGICERAVPLDEGRPRHLRRLVNAAEH